MNKPTILRKVIEAYPDYTITTSGVVTHIKRNTVIVPWLSPKGEFRVQLRTKVRGRSVRRKPAVHRLVATTFLDNPNDYPWVRRKDDDSTNVCVNNLVWVPRSINAENGGPNAVPVTLVDLHSNTRTTLDSVSKLGDFFGRCGSTVIHLIRRSAPYPYLGRYVLVLDEDRLLCAGRRTNKRQPVYVYDKLADTTTEYPGMYAAGYFTGLCEVAGLVRSNSRMPARLGYIISKDTITDHSLITTTIADILNARHEYYMKQAFGAKTRRRK